MKLTAKEKKQLHQFLVKSGYTQHQRTAVWEYILRNDLGIGYFYAKKVEEKGFRILKRSFFKDQPN